MGLPTHQFVILYALRMWVCVCLSILLGVPVSLYVCLPVHTLMCCVHGVNLCVLFR